MEEKGLLVADSEEHLAILHFIFLPRINRALRNFINQWNNHGLRTANYATPMQLFVEGVLNKRGTDHSAVHELLSEAFSEQLTNETVLSTAAVDEVGSGLLCFPEEMRNEIQRIGSSRASWSEEVGIQAYEEILHYLGQSTTATL